MIKSKQKPWKIVIYVYSQAWIFQGHFFWAQYHIFSIALIYRLLGNTSWFYNLNLIKWRHNLNVFVNHFVYKAILVTEF